MQVTFRAWEQSDVPVIAELEKRIFSDAWTEEMLRSAFDRTDFFGLVACIGEETVGYVCSSLLFEDADLSIIAVQEAFRGAGIGGKLLDCFLENVKQKGGERVFLEARVSNAPALGLYKSRGFATTRIRKKYYADGEDAVEMVKTL